jgi:molybdate transport system substrate-binding protein
VDDLVKQGKIAAETHTVVARSAMGVAVRAGAPKPDISSVEAFKRTLLNAKSFAHAPEGATGTHVAKVFERLGIADEMKAKAKSLKNVTGVIQAVADGEAELGFMVMSSLAAARGIEVVGLFPPEFQDYVLYVAGVSATTKEKQATEALIDFLRKERAASVMKSKGLEPLAP